MLFEPLVLTNFLDVPEHIRTSYIPVVAAVHTAWLPPYFVWHWCLPLTNTDLWLTYDRNLPAT